MRLLEQLRDDGRVAGRQFLAGAIGVKDAEGDGLDLVESAQRGDLVLGRDLGDPVR